jgi:3-isopropylmalate/(R)-2-methylmalate dehydratase small subunit
MSDRFSGKAWVYGDNVDTDVIIPARYLSTSNPAELAPHCLEDLDSGFMKKMEPGDLIVAGGNFGCGSSREHAPLAIKGAGVSCVIAVSFARIFFRNALNIGLPILECPEAVSGIESGQRVEVDLAEGRILNLDTGKAFSAKPFPPFLRDLVARGGLVPAVRARLEERRRNAR